MTQRAPTPDEIQAAAAFLRNRGRSIEAIPQDKAGLYKFDGHIRTAHDVIRHAIMAGWKQIRDV